MKKSIIVLILLCFTYLLNAQTYEVSKNTLNSGINNLVKTIISRDDKLTLALNDLVFVSSQEGKFLSLIEVKTKGTNSITGEVQEETYSVVLSEPVVIKANEPYNVGFDIIKGGIELSNVELISVTIMLTKLNQMQENIFARFLKSTLNTVVKGNTFAQNIFSILEIDQTQKDQSVKFESNFYVPQSFAEFFNLGDKSALNNLFIDNKIPSEYPAKSDGTPFLFNNIPIYTGILYDFEKDGNVKSFGKKIINQLGALVVGKKIVKKTDADNIKINGYVSISFSKDYTTPLPPVIGTLITEIETMIKRPASQIDLGNVQTAITKLDNSLIVFDDKSISPRLRQNVILFIDLVHIYLKYKLLSKCEINGREQVKSEIINEFGNYFQSTSLFNSSAGLISLGVSGYYTAINPGKIRYGIVYIPYGLTNSSTEFLTKIQSELHRFILNQKINGSESIKLIINETLDYISYEK